MTASRFAPEEDRALLGRPRGETQAKGPRRALASEPEDTETGEEVLQLVKSGPEESALALESVDWKLVGRLHSQVAERLQDWRRANPEADEGKEEAAGVRLIEQAVAQMQSERLATTGQLYTRNESERLRKALFNSLFRLGRLQYLIEDPRVENVMAESFDRVRLELADGRIVPGPALADSEGELLDFIRELASRRRNARSLSEASPSLEMVLPGQYRLAATLSVSGLGLMIRRHRVKDVTLQDLEDWGTVTPALVDFLQAAVKAGLTIVVSGMQGVGKTTFLRALTSCIPRGEVIGTFESDYELFLKEALDEDGQRRHEVVFDWESREGGERGADGRRAGAETMKEQIQRGFRYNLRRMIVGEVRGAEFWEMMKVMHSSMGSLSTTHARTARGCVEKLLDCAMEQPGTTIEHATRMLAHTVDFIVQLDDHITQSDDGQIKRRYVREIAEVLPAEGGQVSTASIFRHVPAEPAVAYRPPTPENVEALLRGGWNQFGFEAEREANRGLWQEQ
ncbi:MAG: Flp pilus assembly complex ATPase component TadA [Propionibacteriaceae bacterium]|jgi:Flp pilus assembly CpaF family ATPase|nr:Flp pilus assembly complex ATPase component TadA [Propionibacteriaceae bacterium]